MRTGIYTLLVVVLAIVAVAAIRYKAYVIDSDFLIFTAIACDPATESCFVYDCDPLEEECLETAYAKAELGAKYAPSCVEENSCETFACPEDDHGCAVTYCSEDMLEDGEACTVPADGISEPAEEEVDTELETEETAEQES